MTDHPITPPPHLMNQWESEAVEECRSKQNYFGFERETLKLIKAARWGADRELEACCHLLRLQGFDVVDDLRAARRPKPPSLKEQALAALNVIEDKMLGPTTEEKLIRKALEQLDD